MFRVDFNNAIIEKTISRLMKKPTLPDITSSTFFKVSHRRKNSSFPTHELSVSVKIFPFCVVINPEMQVSQLGPSLQSLFNANNLVIGRHINDVFTLLRPDILHIEWDKVCTPLFVSSSRLLTKSPLFHFQFLNYGKSVVFIMESCIPLKAELTKTVKNSAEKEQNANADKSSSASVGTIRLKGQIKYIPSWHKLVFLCHPM
jgi:hypothetical protein